MSDNEELCKYLPAEGTSINTTIKINQATNTDLSYPFNPGESEITIPWSIKYVQYDVEYNDEPNPTWWNLYQNGSYITKYVVPPPQD